MLMFVAQGKRERTGDLAPAHGYVCVCFLPIYSGHQSSSLDVPSGVTQDFSSTFLLRCAP